MDYLAHKKDEVNIQISPSELRLIREAMKTVCEELDEWDFGIRMGEESEVVKKLIEEIDIMLEKFNT